jgi:hypothetical protein
VSEHPGNKQNQESNMNKSNFEMNNLVGRELTDEELMMIQGGSIFGAIGHALSSAGSAIASGVSAVGHAIADGASAVGHALGQGVQAIANGFVNQALADIRRRLHIFR